MKKKGMALGALLMAVAITGYSVSGTYAKYISSVDLTDEARVAKWGFNVTDENGDPISDNKVNLFASSYYNNGNKYVQSLNCDVDGNNCDKVVAPGTHGTYTFKLAGEMETRYNLSFEIDSANDFVVYYKAKTTGAKVGDQFDKRTKAEIIAELSLASTATDKEISDAAKTAGYSEYRPLRYSITYTRGNDTTDLSAALKNLTADKLAAALNKYNADHAATGFAPGVMNQQYAITWEWATENKIDGDDAKFSLVDELDTFAGQNLSKESDKVEFGIKVTATQIASDFSEAN